MSYNRVVLNEITDVWQPETALDLNGFSRFKHGSVDVAQKYSSQLADMLDDRGILESPNLLVTGSCYQFLPVASDHLATELMTEINVRRFGRGLETGTGKTKISRAQLVDGDYSRMSHEQRQTLLAADRLYTDLGRLAGKHLLVIDDVIISGRHEDKIARLLREQPDADVTFVYYAGALSQDATVEAWLNENSVATAQDVLELLENETVAPTSRLAKLILNTFTEADFEQLMSGDTTEVGTKLFKGVINNGYYLFDRYKNQILLWKKYASPPLEVDHLAPLSAEHYSRMKYGSLEEIDYYAAQIFDRIINNSPHQLANSNLVLSPGTYKNIPKAISAITDAVAYRINYWRSAHGVKPAQIVRFYNGSTYFDDYGRLSEAQRQARHENAVRTCSIEEVRDKDLIMLDDISISGATVKTLEKIGESLPVNSFEVITAATCPAGGNSAKVENSINHAGMRGLDDLAMLVNSAGHIINQRAVKFILNSENRPDLARFAAHVPRGFLRQVLGLAMADDMALSPVYKPSMQEVASYV